jgi:hypothetical protein
MKNGYTAVLLLVFVTVATVICAAAVNMAAANFESVTTFQLSQETYAAAESGMENALLRFLRDPSFTGETFTIGTITVTSTVTGTDPYTIRSEAVNGNFQRSIRVTVTRSDGILSITSWAEVYD